MSQARVDGDQPAPTRIALHNRIIGDDAPDDKYLSRMSNRDKVTFITRVLDYPEKGFDLTLAFPMEDWLGSDDNAMVCAGLYLNDLREQYFREALAQEPEAQGELWTRHAEAEHFRDLFNAQVQRRLNGRMISDRRVLH